jgi:hypothetical protein
MKRNLLPSFRGARLFANPKIPVNTSGFRVRLQRSLARRLKVPRNDDFICTAPEPVCGAAVITGFAAFRTETDGLSG